MKFPFNFNLKNKNNMKNLNKIQKLHLRAYEILYLAVQSQEKYESILRYNVEVAAPNGFTPKSDEVIAFQEKVTARLMNSYFLVVNEIKTFDI